MWCRILVNFVSSWGQVPGSKDCLVPVQFVSNSCRSRVQMHQQIKSVVSVAEMARMVGLSRQRFYQLLGSTFPLPLYWIATRRPFYTEEMQQICLEVRRRNCGINGKPVLFYCGYPPRGQKPKAKPKSPAKKRQHVALINGLRCPRTAGQRRASGGSGQAAIPQRSGWQGRGRGASGRVPVPQASGFRR